MIEVDEVAAPRRRQRHSQRARVRRRSEAATRLRLALERAALADLEPAEALGLFLGDVDLLDQAWRGPVRQNLTTRSTCPAGLRARPRPRRRSGCRSSPRRRGPGALADRVAEEHSLNASVHNHAAAYPIDWHGAILATARILRLRGCRSVRGARHAERPMNALWLLVGLVVGAGAVLVALRPRLRSLSARRPGRRARARARRARSDLEHERALAQERLATMTDAQERLSASFKALSAEALQVEHRPADRAQPRAAARRAGRGQGRARQAPAGGRAARRAAEGAARARRRPAAARSTRSGGSRAGGSRRS